jgi:nitronate monooxygenase
MGTRFIATTECTAHADYKLAILEAGEDDIVLTDRMTGVPVSVIRTPYIEETGTKAGPFARWMLRGRKTKRWMRTIYGLQSVWKLKRSSLRAFSYRDYLQAGKSVAGIERIEPAGEIVGRFRAAAERAEASSVYA